MTVTFSATSWKTVNIGTYFYTFIRKVIHKKGDSYYIQIIMVHCHSQAVNNTGRCCLNNEQFDQWLIEWTGSTSWKRVWEKLSTRGDNSNTNPFNLSLL